jgi:hypothetical protein
MTPSIKGLLVTFSITTQSIIKLCHYAECGYSESECLVLFIVMLNLIVVSVVILNVVMLSVTTPETYPRVKLLREVSLR